MAPMDRDSSRDREVIRHQHSFSSDTTGRLSVPMWDSSDPERAPPPLPLNPQSTLSPTKATASHAIAAAAQALVDKARESNGLASYTASPSPPKSPDKSIVRSPQHKKVQSLQTGSNTSSVKDLRSYLDSFKLAETRSPDRSFSRDSTPSPTKRDDKDYFAVPSSPEKSPTRSSTPTSTSRDLFRDSTPTYRPGSRAGNIRNSILSENTPPSATMLALQTMPGRDPDMPLPTTRSYSMATPSGSSGTFDAISSQILSLTTIATGLQREMAQLSRRSKDNATDLISLKEATKTRDEDIRKTLKDLVVNVNTKDGGATLTRGNMLIDSKPYNTPPSQKQISLPRIPSFASFDEHRVANTGSPNPFAVSGEASVAMLEKIIREMVTKEGQERLLSTLESLLEKHGEASSATARKVEELAGFIKTNAPLTASSSAPSLPAAAATATAPGPSPASPATAKQALIKPGADGDRYASPKAADFVGEGMLKLLRKVKDSSAETGGLTGEVKALLVKLRGEVLGMGRELGEKIERASLSSGSGSGSAFAASRGMPDEPSLQHEDVRAIVEESLGSLEARMHDMIRAQRRESEGARTTATTQIDGKEIYDVVRHALMEQGMSREQAVQLYTPSSATDGLVDREGILSAVKEAYEEYKPEIEVQQYGLDREEILAVLKEGLEDYQTSKDPSQEGTALAERQPAVGKEEIYDAMQEALRSFHPPSSSTTVQEEMQVQMQEMKEELLSSVRQCLDDLRPTLELQAITGGSRLNDGAGSERGAMDASSGMTREVLLDTVREALLSSGGPNAARELEISADELFAAVRAALDADTPFAGYCASVLEKLHDISESMRGEFQQYSAASGRDTEQVLDALKDGLEDLRAQVECYVDRAQDVTGKEDILHSLAEIRREIADGATGGSAGGHASDGRILEYVRREFEHLHEVLASQQQSSRGLEGERGLSSDAATLAHGHKEEIIAALTAGIATLQHAHNQHERDGSSSMGSDPVTLELLKQDILTGTSLQKDEIIDALRDHLPATRLPGIPGNDSLMTSGSEETFAAIRGEFEDLRESLATMIANSAAQGNSEAILASLDALRAQFDLQGALFSDNESLASLKEQLHLVHTTLSERADGPAIDQGVLEALQGEFEHLRSTIASSMVSNGGGRGDTDEVLDAVRLGLDDLRSHLERKLDSREGHATSHSDFLDALNEGLDGLREEIKRSPSASGGDAAANTAEIMAAMKLGLSELRSEMEKMHSSSSSARPTSSSSSTARDMGHGGAVVLADANTPNTSGDVAAATTTTVSTHLQKNDLEKLELLMAQLQIKVEAVNESVADRAAETPSVDLEGVATKDDLASMASKLDVASMATKGDVIGLEEMIKEMQTTIALMAGRGAERTTGAALKEDTDAIETLLRNTKAQIDETVVTKGDFDAVEAVVRLTNEAVEDLKAKFTATPPSKEDLDVVEILARDIKSSIEAVKKVVAPTSDEEGSEHMAKADMDVIAVLVAEMKAKLDDLNLPDAEQQVVDKAQMDQLLEMTTELRATHDDLKARYESDIAVTARAFDDRKTEAEDMIERLANIRAHLLETKEQVLIKMDEDFESGIETLDSKLDSLQEVLDEEKGVHASVKELQEVVSQHLEKAQGSLDDAKTDQDLKHSALLERYADHKELIIAEVTEKIESTFNTLLEKYDAADERTKDFADKAAEHSELAKQSNTMAEELKVTMDTLGAAVTTLSTTLPETVDKLSDDSRTVFNRVDDTFCKVEETHADAKVEHSMTREEVARVLGAVESLHHQSAGMTPEMAEVLHQIKALVAEHYESFKGVQEKQEATTKQEQHFFDIKNAIAAGFQNLPALTNGATTTSGGHAPEHSPRFDAQPMHAKLDELLSRDLPPSSYDDAAVHAKLDTLISRDVPASAVTSATEPGEQIERLDKIHATVLATAAEVSAFMETQTKLLTVDHDNKRREAEEVGLALERRRAEKEQAESDLATLREEQHSIRTDVDVLRKERDELASHKAKLQADLSSLETALEIRREELLMMDSKADLLERRIMEGIMNHSRAALLTKQGTSTNATPRARQLSSAKGGRDLRRIPSTATDSTFSGPGPNAGGETTRDAGYSKPPTTMHPVVKFRPSPRKLNSGIVPTRTGSMPGSASRNNNRRIMSLSTISHNTPTGAAGSQRSLIGNSGAPPAPSASWFGHGTSATSIKRSQSVKTPALRKGTWGGRASLGASTTTVGNGKGQRSVSEFDQENSTAAVLPEEDESLSQTDKRDFAMEDEEEEPTTQIAIDDDSHAIVLHGRAESIDGTSSDDDADAVTVSEDRRSSYGTTVTATEDGTGTGASSYMTGSDLDRRTSYGSTVRSTLNGGIETETIDEEVSSDDDDDDDAVSATSSRQSHADDEASYIDPTKSELESTIANEIVAQVNAMMDLQAHHEQDSKGYPGSTHVNTTTTSYPPPALATKGAYNAVWGPPSDSGLGTDLPSAAHDSASSVNGKGGYFRSDTE